MDTDTTLRSQVTATLEADLPRDQLLRELSALAENRQFRQLAPVWAPALVIRDAAFFENFLLRHLPRWEMPELIQALLPYLEAIGQDRLFGQLYPRSNVSEDSWNKQVLDLARSNEPDDVVAKAIERRNLNRSWWSLKEDTALALYRRNADLFRKFILQHLRQQWYGPKQSYNKLSSIASKNGDNELYWAIFRVTCDSKSWNNELRQLLKSKVPAENIVDELTRRQPSHLYNFDLGILLDYLEQYGEVMLPFIQENLRWLWGKTRDRLQRGLERLHNPSVYWALFFEVADTSQWNQELRNLLGNKKLPDLELLGELQLRTPDQPSGWWWSRWRLQADVALALYRRQPRLLRPFIEAFLFEPDLKLFEEAQKQGDETFLDFLTFRISGVIDRLIDQAYPPERWQRWRKPDPEAGRKIEQYGGMLVERLKRLYSDSPESYIRHAANIFAYFRAFAVWSFARSMKFNPAFRYLVEQHHEQWARSPGAIRELLESPNIYVQLVGLYILADGGASAADRVIESLPMLQALLLGRTKRNTKKKVLDALVAAAGHSPAHAEQILPVLETLIDFHGKRAISEQVMVAYVRLKYALPAQQPAGA